MSTAGADTQSSRVDHRRDSFAVACPGPIYTPFVTRDELILRTRQLIAEGERLDASPSLTALQTWLQLSDDLLGAAWGSMDRYHLAWLMVGKPKGIIRGRPLTPTEEAAYVREVASAKAQVLRASLDAVERQRMPFRGETGGVGAGQGMGAVPGALGGLESGPADQPAAPGTGASHRRLPMDPALAARLEEVRRSAAEHAAHAPEAPATPGQRRAPRPERLQR